LFTVTVRPFLKHDTESASLQDSGGSSSSSSSSSSSNSNSNSNSSNSLANTMLILPIACGSATLEYYNSLDLRSLQRGNVKVVAIEFGMLLHTTLKLDDLGIEIMK
jgi:hypothetical protein